jgi:hypothetical protein
VKIDIYHHNPPNPAQKLWGVWLHSEGWLKSSKPNGTVDVCAFVRKNEAKSLARLLGGRAMFIDDSLASPSVETKLKEAELRNREKHERSLLCRTLRTLQNRAKK